MNIIQPYTPAISLIDIEKNMTEYYIKYNSVEECVELYIINSLGSRGFSKDEIDNIFDYLKKKHILIRDLIDIIINNPYNFDKFRNVFSNCYYKKNNKTYNKESNESKDYEKNVSINENLYDCEYLLKKLYNDIEKWFYTLQKYEIHDCRSDGDFNKTIFVSITEFNKITTSLIMDTVKQEKMSYNDYKKKNHDYINNAIKISEVFIKNLINYKFKVFHPYKYGLLINHNILYQMLHKQLDLKDISNRSDLISKLFKEKKDNLNETLGLMFA